MWNILWFVLATLFYEVAFSSRGETRTLTHKRLILNQMRLPFRHAAMRLPQEAFYGGNFTMSGLDNG